MLDQTNYTFKSESETLKITKESMTIMKGIIKNGLYILVGKTVIGKASPVQSNIDSKVKFWHLRLEHISQKGLNELDKYGLLDKEKLGELPLCEQCVYEKATRVGFKSSSQKSK